MKSVWKFELPITDRFSIPMPVGARLLNVETQNEQPCLWALVDPAAEKEGRQFRLAGTGHPINNPDELSYVGTCMMRGGGLVWHLFEVKG